MRILVTGSNGYIGNSLCKRLLEMGHFVIGVDREDRDITHYATSFLRKDYVAVDETDLELNRVEAVIHMAGTSLLAPSVTDPISYYENNVAKTIVFLNTILHFNSKIPVIFSSSASIYGDRGPNAINEMDLVMDPPQPGSPYAWTMWMKENILHDCVSAYGMRAMALRYFNVAGGDFEANTGQQHDAPHIIPAMFRAFKNKKKFTMYGTENELVDTSCRRDYIHVRDVCEAHVRALDLLQTSDAIPFEINVGTGIATSNKQVLAQVEETVGGKLDIEWKPERETDIKFLYADTTRAEKWLNYKPQFDLKTIVGTAWRWHMERI